MRLKDKVVVISGGAGGIGKEISLLFSKNGAKVIIIDINQKDSEKIAKAICNDDGKAIALSLDVTEEEQVKKAVDLIFKKYGRIDVLVNCIGMSPSIPTIDLSLNDWRRIIDINLTGTFLLCREVGKIMTTQNSGKIINFGSTVSMFAAPNLAHYTAAKHGVLGLTRSLAVDWGKYNINVNCICPGSTKTPLFSEFCPEEEIKKREKRIPLKRIGLPEEQAKVALFLATEDSDYINGACICVDGGISSLSPVTTT